MISGVLREMHGVSGKAVNLAKPCASHPTTADEAALKRAAFGSTPCSHVPGLGFRDSGRSPSVGLRDTGSLPERVCRPPAESPPGLSVCTLNAGLNII